MNHYTIDLSEKFLYDLDINENFFKLYFDNIKETNIFLDISYNNLTEISAIQILDYFISSKKEKVIIDFSNNYINCINNEFIKKIIDFLDTYTDSRINLRVNLHSTNIQDFLFYDLLPKIIY